MDQLNDTPSPDKVETDGPAHPMRAGSKLKEFLLLAGASLTAVVAVGGGILVLARGPGPSIDAAVATPGGPQPTAVAPSPRANAATIFRCEVNGKTVYADVPCSSRNIRAVDVFVNEGFQPTDTSTLMARKLARDEPAPVASSSGSATAQRCSSLDEAIRQNEQTARLPQSGQPQADLTQQRRRLLDEKHGLGC